MSTVEVRVPDLGDFSGVDVIEVHVKAGDRIAVEDPLVTLETDKATMDVPAPRAGTVVSVALKTGAKVSAGDLVLTLDAAEGAAAEPAGKPAAAPPARAAVAGAPPRAAAPSAARSTAATQATAVATPLPGKRLAVIGAGPGGYTAAFRAADLGLEVTLVERWPTLGGVCLNVGCIPSKALLHAARVIEEAHEMGARGLAFGKPELDTKKLVGWKSSVVRQLTSGLDTLAKQRKVRVVRGTARFKSATALEVERDGGSELVAFDQCIIAAGSEASVLHGLPDDPRIIDSTGALELEVLPKRMLVVGGGIIGLEMATVYDALGVKVSVVELTKTLIPGCDRDLVKPLEKRIGGRYESIMLGTRVIRMEAKRDGIVVHFEGDQAPPKPETYGLVLVAVGRS
ncbi:MAG TPA: FAD-dependent oxidoreductase, partial [Gammaproteobacteria bacterium]